MKAISYPRYSSSEKNFFLKVALAGFLLFVFSIVIPRFFVVEADFWLPRQVSADLMKSTIAVADEGFFIAPLIQTEKGNREGIKEVIEIEVQLGDTVSSIAKKYGISTATIVQNNNLYNPNALKKGQKLTILPVDGILHTIKKGETVNSLAKKYKTETEKIIAQNSLKEDSILEKDQQIIIPGVKKNVPVPRRYIASSTFTSTPSSAGNGTDYGGTLFFPCEGKYTQYYHYGHYAVDIAKSGGSTLWAAETGEVIKAQGGWNGGYGNMVIVDHGDGMKTLYAHMKEIYVNVGDDVSRGQAIGYMGNTGRVYGRTGIHLHFEVIINGTRKNPVAYF